MPSNKDLIASIVATAEAYHVDVPGTDGKSNAELVATLAEVKADAAAKAEADKEASDAAAKAKKPPYTVAEGKSITSKRGILADGEEVKADFLAGGDETVKALVKSGHVVKN